MPLKPIEANHSAEKKIFLLRPRGFCAGVVRAIDVVKIALDLYGPPVYVRKEIVHNKHVVDELRHAGAIFVEELQEVPPGARAIFSAHGVSPAVRVEAKQRRLEVIDATCPLVTKVHLEAVRFARDGYSIVLIGHKDHDEVIGTLGEVPDRSFLVETVEYEDDAINRHLSDPRLSEHVEALAQALRDVVPFDEPHVEAAVRRTAEQQDIKAAPLIHVTRVAVTGRTASPGIFEVLALLGRERTLARLERLGAFLTSRN